MQTLDKGIESHCTNVEKIKCILIASSREKKMSNKNPQAGIRRKMIQIPTHTNILPQTLPPFKQLSKQLTREVALHQRVDGIKSVVALLTPALIVPVLVVVQEVDILEIVQYNGISPKHKLGIVRC